MPTKRANVKNEKQYEALKDKGMSKERAAKIANSPGASKKGGQSSGSSQSRCSSGSGSGGNHSQKVAAGRKGGQATAREEELSVAESSNRGDVERTKADLDRELNELLQELRVMLPGVQVLLAFLLTLPFTNRFVDPHRR